MTHWVSVIPLMLKHQPLVANCEASLICQRIPKTGLSQNPKVLAFISVSFLEDTLFWGLEGETKRSPLPLRDYLAGFSETRKLWFCVEVVFCGLCWLLTEGIWNQKAYPDIILVDPLQLLFGWGSLSEFN